MRRVLFLSQIALCVLMGTLAERSEALLLKSKQNPVQMAVPQAPLNFAATVGEKDAKTAKPAPKTEAKPAAKPAPTAAKPATPAPATPAAKPATPPATAAKPAVAPAPAPAPAPKPVAAAQAAKADPVETAKKAEEKKKEEEEKKKGEKPKPADSGLLHNVVRMFNMTMDHVCPPAQR